MIKYWQSMHGYLNFLQALRAFPLFRRAVTSLTL